MESKLNHLLSAEEIIKEVDVKLNLERIAEERKKFISLNEAIIKNKGKVGEMEADIEKLDSDVANGLINNESVDDMVLRRSMIREGLADVKAVPARFEIQVKEIEQKIKGLESVLFHKITDVLRIEREKRVRALEEAIKTGCAEWLHITGTLSKNFSGGVIPPGWSNLKQDIYKILDTVYASTGANWRG